MTRTPPGNIEHTEGTPKTETVSGVSLTPGKLLLQELFGIDLRTVAFFRIALALSLLADLFMRSFDIEAFYTDRGVMPRSILPSQWNGAFYFTFHSWVDSPAMVWLLFGVNAIFLTLLLIGWNSRVMSVIALIFLVSLQSRNPLILQGGDVLLRCMTFWSIFLPLGDYLAIDARKRAITLLPGDDPKRPVRAFSWGTVAILLQTAFVYWFTALLKNDPVWWQNGYAIYLALNLDILSKPLGRTLAAYPLITYILTFVTIYVEAFGPFFAFIPLRNGIFRTVTVFAFWFFHLIALQSMMYLGPFPWTCALAWTTFLPSYFWDSVAPWWAAGRENGIRRSLSRWSSAYMPTRIVALRNQPLKHRPVRLGLKLPANILAAFYLLVITSWNFRSVYFGALVHWFPVNLNAIAELPHVDQCWDMFSPRPMSDDGWYVIAGKLRDGSKVDLMPYLAEEGDAGPLTWKKPREVGEQFHDERWRKYFLNMWPNTNQRFRAFLASYIARRWNSTHKGAKELCTFEIYYMREDTPPQYAPIQKAVPVLLWKQWCFDEFSPDALKAKSKATQAKTGVGKPKGQKEAPSEKQDTKH